MRHIDRGERRRRLVVRHHLARPAGTVEQVAGDLVGLHSSDPATVVLSLRARLDPFAVADLEDALYERRTLLRMLAMRRTMFVVPLDLAAVMDAACTQALVPGERRKLVAMLETAGVTDDVDAWIERVGAETLAALRAGGPLPASQLTKLVPDLARQLRMAVGKKYEGTVGVSTRMLFLLSAEGRIARARPLGSWLSSQYRWVPMADWIGAAARLLDAREAPRRAGPPLAAGVRAGHDRRPRLVDEVDEGRRAGRARRPSAPWRSRRTPATTPAAPAWVLADDLDDTPAEAAAPDGLEPVALLPGLDPTIMGWKERGWYLGPHRGPLFDRNGNAGPTVWVGGRAVGAWSQRDGGEVVTRLLEPVDGRDRDAHRRRRRAPDGVDGRRAGDPAVPDAARPRARRPRLIVRA